MNSIILIGPMFAGKSTVAELLSKRLKLPRISLDDVRWAYYAEIGYSEDEARQQHEAGGLDAVVAYWKPFEAHSVERVLADYPNDHIIDFGAGHSVYEDEGLFRRVAQALTPFPYVALLLPSADNAASLPILRERGLAEGAPDLTTYIEHFLQHPSNMRLAKRTFYTEETTPEETSEEVAAWARPRVL